MKTYVYKNTTMKKTFYLEQDGAAYPGLAGATVKFSMKAKGGSLKVNLGAVVVEDPATGELSYLNAGTDFDTVDSYDAQFKITIGGVDDFSDAFEMEVRDVVA